MVSFKEFREEIGKVVPEESLHFSVMSDTYYADYKPKYPEKTAADMSICYCFLSDEASVYGNLEALVPTVKRCKGLDDLIDLLKSGD